MGIVTEDNRYWWVASAMALCVVVLTIDFFGVSVALPSIGRELGTSTSTLAWVINAFMLGLVGTLVVGGRLGDLLGRRRMLLAGLLTFTASSILCGLAPSAVWLIVGRAIQGAAAGFLFSNSLSIATNAFPSDKRHVAVSFWAGIGTVGSAVGPFVGGLLTDELSWRWFFFINIPFGVAALFLILLVVRESRDEDAPRIIDWMGCTLTIAGMVLLVLGLELSNSLGWQDLAVWITLVVAVVVLAAFVIVERKVRFPLIDFQLFSGRDFVCASLIGFLINFTLGALMLFLALYLQHVLRLSPLTAGLIFLGYSVMLAVVSLLNAKIMETLGPRHTVIIGMALNAASFLILFFCDTETGIAVIVAALALGGAGQALAYTTAASIAMASVPEQKGGAASGTLGCVRIAGTAVGVAVATALFKALENDELSALIAKAGGSLSAASIREIKGLLAGTDAAAAELAKAAPAAASTMRTIVDQAFVTGFGGLMAFCAVLSVIGVAVAFMLRPVLVTAKDEVIEEIEPE
ncbi:MAG: MFS transporter [Pseudomonadota bacterium]